MYKLISFVFILLISINVKAEDIISLPTSPFISYSVINLPEYRNNEPWVKIIKNSGEWGTFINEIYMQSQSSTIDYAIPSIDFTNHMIVVGGFGAKPNGSYSIAIDSFMVTHDSSIYINVTDIGGDGCLSTQVITYPQIAILIEKTEKPIYISSKEAFYYCN